MDELQVEPRKLDIGCGLDARGKRTVGLDMNLALLVPGDVCYEMRTDRRYLPFKDNTFGKIRMIDIIEHIPDIVWWMSEIHRIATPDADVHIKFPHKSSREAYSDVTHINHFEMHICDHFDPAKEYGRRYPHYNNFRRNFPFEVTSIGIHFYGGKLGKLSKALAWARGNDFYESYIANLLPIATVEIYLKVRK